MNIIISANGSGKIKCRLDLWLISKQLLTRVTETDISAYYDSDHSPVTISLTPEEQGVPRGPGLLWKFNNSLLENEEFVTKLKLLIQNAKEKYKQVTDKKLFWEVIKMEIRIFSIRFVKRKAKEKREMEFELLRKLHSLNVRIDAAPEGNPLANEVKKIKIKLDQMAEEKTRGCIVRSRARWYEPGEKCNKYFLKALKLFSVTRPPERTV